MSEYGKYNYKQWMRCTKCTLMVGVLAITAAGEAIPEPHPCKDIKVDIQCRFPDDVPARAPVWPDNFRVQVAVSTSGTALSSGTYVLPLQSK